MPNQVTGSARLNGKVDIQDTKLNGEFSISAATLGFQDGAIDKVNAILAMGEMAPAEEVGSLIAFLASGACRHLTGATIDLNGASYIR